MALATAQKGASTVAEYFGKMKGLANEMASAGKKLEDEELASYILAGLDIDFSLVVSAVAARTDPITLGELYTQLVGFEQRMDLLTGGNSGNSSASLAARGRGGAGGRGRGRAPTSRGRGRNGGRFHGGNGDRPAWNGDRPTCQLCGKEGHAAVTCRKRFDASFHGPSTEGKIVSAATTSYGVDTNWYIDTGATDHITSDLDKLTIRDKYTGHDQVHAASGAGMKINQVGHSIVSTPKRNLHLKNILYVPQANKSLVSVHKLASDNRAFLEFHPDHFLIKEQETKRTLLRGKEVFIH